MQLLNLF